MLVNPVMTIFRVLTWCCVIAFAVLSLLPAQELADLSLLPALEMARTRLPPTRALLCLCRGGGNRDGGLRSEPRQHADHRRALDVRRHPGVSAALFAPSASVDRGFRGVGAGSFVRRARRRPPLASPVGSAALRGRGSAFCTLPGVPTH